MATRVHSGSATWLNAVVMMIALATVPALLFGVKFPKVTVGLSYFDKQIENAKKAELTKTGEAVELPKTGEAVELPKTGEAVALPEGIKAIGVTEDGRVLMLLKAEKTVDLPKAEETVDLPKAEETVDLPKAGKFVALPEGVGAIRISENGRLTMIPKAEKKVRVPKAEKPVAVSEPLWQPSPFLPDSLDRVLNRVYAYRQYFYRYTSKKNPGSTFDKGRYLNSFENIVKYLPRAIQIGMFSPFPNRWIEPGTLPVYTVMRRLNGLEMFCLYVAMLGLVPAIYYWRRRFELWVVFVFFVYFTLVPVIILPNIGTMVRYRYAPIMALGGLGIAAIGVWLQSRRQKRTGFSNNQSEKLLNGGKHER